MGLREHGLLGRPWPMDIHFVSTLTPDDEERLATMVVETAKALLACFPISYTLRVTAASDKVLQHTQSAPAASGARSPRTRSAKVVRFGAPADELETPSRHK